MKHGVKTIGRLAAVAVVGASAVMLTSASPASANAYCGKIGDYRDGTVRTIHSAVNMRSGSNIGCVRMGTTRSGDVLQYWCFTQGSDGYSWTFLGNLTTGVKGWVRDNLLPGNGSYRYCGF